MKNLKLLQQELLSKANSSRVLGADEQKLIVGGNYDSFSECKKYCGGGQGGPGGKWKTGKGTCYVDFVRNGNEYWDCRDS